MKRLKCNFLGKSNNGFTLIELLAVIVILAIIALIATPIILNIINDSKKSAAVDSAYGYIEAIETHLAMNELDEENYPIMGISLDGDNSVSAFNNVKLKGTKPSSGTVTLSSGRVTKATLTINGYIVEYDGTIAKVQGTSSEDNNSDDNLVSGPTKIDATSTDTYKAIVYLDPTDLTKTCNASEYANNLDSYVSSMTLSSASDGSKSPTGLKTGCMKWYVYKDDGTNYTMILDHNISYLVKWVSENDYIAAGGTEEDYGTSGKNDKGPITVNKLLTEDTSSWVSSLNPRLITADEVANIVGADRDDTIKWSSSKTYTGTVTNIETQTSWFYLDGSGTTYSGWQTQVATSQGASKYAWLYDYTSGCVSHGCNVEDSPTDGYWTSTPIASASAFYIEHSGALTNINGVSSRYSIRPVITISKDLLK